MASWRSLDVLRTDGAEIWKDGSRARTAIQREGNRPVLALDGVRGKDHLPNFLVIVVAGSDPTTTV
jgi:hypothetical protein